MLRNAENAIRALTRLGIALIGLGIIVGIIASGTGAAPFLGNVADGIIGLVRSLGQNGVVGLISLGVILYILRD